MTEYQKVPIYEVCMYFVRNPFHPKLRTCCLPIKWGCVLAESLLEYSSYDFLLGNLTELLYSTREYIGVVFKIRSSRKDYVETCANEERAVKIATKITPTGDNDN